MIAMKNQDELVFTDFWISNDFYTLDFDEIRVSLTEKESQSLQSIRQVFREIENIDEITIEISNYDLFLDEERIDEKEFEGIIRKAILIIYGSDYSSSYLRLYIDDNTEVIVEGIN